MPELRNGRADAYYAERFGCVKIPIFSQNNQENSAFELSVPIGISLRDLATVISRIPEANLEARKDAVIFFKRDGKTGKACDWPLEERGTTKEEIKNGLFFRILENISPTEFEKMGVYRFQFSLDGYSFVFNDSIVLKKQATYREALDKLRSENLIEINDKWKLKCWSVMPGSFGREVTLDSLLPDGQVKARIDVISDSKYIQVYSEAIEESAGFMKDPCVLTLIQSESMKSVKERLEKTWGITDEALDWQLRGRMGERKRILKDADVLYDAVEEGDVIAVIYLGAPVSDLRNRVVKIRR
jgi:hypothetical protein